MADKQTIQKHLALTSTIKLSASTPRAQGDDARKGRIMDHIRKSRGC